MQSLKSAARRGAIISVTAVSALALASCSAGHVTQTADKVAAVDGASASTEDNKVAVRDVTILVEPDGSAALKFTAVNQGYDTDVISLESVKVDGQRVDKGVDVPVRTGTRIGVGGVLTLRLLAAEHQLDDEDDSRTMRFTLVPGAGAPS